MMSATLLLTKAQLVYHSLPFPCHCDVNGFHSFLGFHSADRGTIAGSPGPIFRQMSCSKNWKMGGSRSVNKNSILMGVGNPTVLRLLRRAMVQAGLPIPFVTRSDWLEPFRHISVAGR